MKEYKQLGAYAIIINDDNILLINKVSGPYDGKLDLPGGTIEFGETPDDALIGELLEEVGIEITNYNLFDTNSITFDWNYKDDTIIKVHHTGIFYKVHKYNNEIKTKLEIDDQNDDSLGANWYNIKNLDKNKLSKIAILELEKLNYLT